MNKDLKELLVEYTKALQFGVADLNQSVREHDDTLYFKAIERHQKLAQGVNDAVNSIELIAALTER